MLKDIRQKDEFRTCFYKIEKAPEHTGAVVSITCCLGSRHKLKEVELSLHLIRLSMQA